MGAALGAGGCPPPAPSARNLVLVVIDTLRQDRVSAYGYPRRQTPFFDELAGSGALADGLSPTSWTKPAVATILTGLHPLRHQLAAGGDVLPKQAITLTELLKAEGYSTMALSTNGLVSRGWGFGRGFDVFLASWLMGCDRFAPSAQVNEDLLPRLADLRPPYFLYVHYLDPHQPYDPPATWDGQPLPPDLAALAPMKEGELLPDRGVVSSRLLAAASDLYDGEVRANDDSLQRLVERLRELGLERDTLLIVTSDHGEEFFEHGRPGHGKSLYEEVSRVPLVFHAPGVVRAGGRLGTVGLADLVPTALELLDVRPELPEGYRFDGRSRAPELRAGRDLDPDAGTAAGQLLYLESEADAGLAYYSGSHKVLIGKNPYLKAFFDLRADPAEQRDLVGRPGTRAAFDTAARGLAERYSELMRTALGRRSTTSDSELVRELAALGYVKFFDAHGSERAFPRRLAPADPRPGGLLGTENVASFRACIRLVEVPADQLRRGWFAVEGALGGRWSAPNASLALPLAASPESPEEIVVEGTSFRPDVARVEIDGEGVAPRTYEIAPGPFRVVVPRDSMVAARDAAVPLLRLVIEPPFRPREHGSTDM
ncbi:MAG: sulfatase, partial [Thermoanaerobaculia bacterium]|nr:sulfatase [Thermoanaerobaculia bacterium]